MIVGRALAALLVLSCGSVRSDAATMASLSWLSGCWNSDDGETGSGEYWTPLAGDSLLGISRTVREGRTVAHEFLQVRPLDDGGIALFALPSGQTETTFRLVSIQNSEAVFENPEHDFPQRIAYRRASADRLEAWIEGTENGHIQRFEFPMTRVPCDAASVAE